MWYPIVFKFISSKVVGEKLKNNYGVTRSIKTFEKSR